MALLSSIPRCRSLYSRYLSTISERSLWALAVFWYLDESLITSGEESARVSSSYLASIWLRRSNICFCRFAPNRFNSLASSEGNPPCVKPLGGHRASRPHLTGIQGRQVDFTTSLTATRAVSSGRGGGTPSLGNKGPPDCGAFPGVLHQGHMPSPGQHQQLRVFDAPVKHIGAGNVNHPVLIAPDDERWRLYQAQP